MEISEQPYAFQDINGGMYCITVDKYSTNQMQGIYMYKINCVCLPCKLIPLLLQTHLPVYKHVFASVYNGVCMQTLSKLHTPYTCTCTCTLHLIGKHTVHVYMDT